MIGHTPTAAQRAKGDKKRDPEPYLFFSYNNGISTTATDGTPMANRRWHYHFLGHETDPLAYNDGTGLTRDIIFEEREPDYSEGNEQMTLVEHAEGGRQIRKAESEDASHGIGDFNVFKKF